MKFDFTAAVKVLLPDSASTNDVQGLVEDSHPTNAQGTGKGITEAPTESDYIRYFHYLKTKRDYKCTSIWSIHGRLNGCHKRRFGKSLLQWSRIGMLLKTYEKGHVKKKASVFRLNEIEAALQIPKTTSYWVIRKAAMSVAFCGGLRCCELTSIAFGNVRVDDEACWVDFNQGKQRGEEKINGFAIPFNRDEPEFCMATRVVNYRNKLIECMPNVKPEDRFWRRVLKRGFSTTEVMGKEKLADIGKNVAAALNLAKPHTYTGHCFRYH